MRRRRWRDIARRQFPGARRVTALCGRGNNGGDGMMAARLLADAGLAVTVILLGSPDEIKGDAAIAWRELEASGPCTIHVVNSAGDLSRHNDALEADLVLDAVVGTGIQAAAQRAGAGRAGVAEVCSKTNENSGGGSSLRLAGGFDQRSGERPRVSRRCGRDLHRAQAGACVRAVDAVVGSAGRGGARSARPTRRSPQICNIHWAGSAQSLVHTPRAADSNKGKFGHVLVVGGSFGSAGGKAGAPAMTSLAALRVGAGLVTAAVPAPALAVSVQPCARTDDLASQGKRCRAGVAP